MSRHKTVTDQPELPKEWKWVPLGEILTNIIGGGTPSKSNPSYWDGKIPWLTIKDMRTRRPIDSIDHISDAAVKESSTNIIPADTVIIATRVGLGKVIRVPYDATINQDLKALIPKDGIDKCYLEYWIVSIADYLESIGSGTTVKGIRLETLRELPFPLAPSGHQKRVVAEIEKQFSRLDEAVASLKRIQANLKRYKAAMLKAAVEGKLTEQWRKDHPGVEPADQLLKRILAERRAKWEAEELAKMKAKGIKPKDDLWKKKYKEPAGPNTANLPKLPEGWVWATVEQLSDVMLGKMLDKAKHHTGNRMAYLRNVNIRWGHIETDDLQEMYIEDDELERYGLRNGDVLVCEGGEPGRAAVWNGIISEMKYQKALHRVRCRSGYDPRMLVVILEHLAKLGRLEKWFTGSTIKHFTRESFVQLPVPLSSKNEQKSILEEIDRRLSVTEELEATIETSLKRAERLRQTILQRAFSGWSA